MHMPSISRCGLLSAVVLAASCDANNSDESSAKEADAIETVSTFASVPGESPWIFGIHQEGGEGRMKDAGRPGWIVFTEKVGHDAMDKGTRDYSSWSSQKYGVIVRLNNDYEPGGALPCESDYDAFAARVANFVSGSHGAHIWAIGNETNFSREWPACGATECANHPGRQPITAARYASAFRKVRDHIHALPGREHDQVVIQGTGPANDEISCVMPAGYDWIDYHVDILKALRVGGELQADGFALHAYTHGSDSSLVTSDELMLSAPTRHYQFRSYRDFLEATPDFARQLPVYVTESDQEIPHPGGSNTGWDDRPNDWVQKAYAEIDTWNSGPGHQRIRALALYRWFPDDTDYDFSTKKGVLDDFGAALLQDYRWDRAQCEQYSSIGGQTFRVCDGPNGRFLATFKQFGVAAIGLPITNESCVGNECQQVFERLRANRSAQAPCPYGACLSFSGVDAVKRDFGQDVVGGLVKDCDSTQFVRRPQTCASSFSGLPGDVGALEHIYTKNGGLQLYGYPVSRVMINCPWEGGQTRPCVYTERAKLGWFSGNQGTDYEWQGMRLGAQELGL